MYVLFASPSDSNPPPKNPLPKQSGSLEISASTTGDNQNSDGYAVTVGGSTSKKIDPNGSATFSGLNEGNHQVELTGLKANCSVAGQNPRTLSVEAALRPAPPSPSTAKPVAFSRSKCLLKETGRTRPPLEPGPSGVWDSRLAGAAPSSVVKFNGTYYLYYVGANGDRSSDGGTAERSVGVAMCPASGDPTDPDCSPF
jgi:hypothetical protein